MSTTRDSNGAIRSIHGETSSCGSRSRVELCGSPVRDPDGVVSSSHTLWRVSDEAPNRTDEPAIRILGAGAEWADGSEAYVLSILREAEDRSSTSDELAAKVHDWPTRYHFSRLRSRILSPLRLGPGKRVLDLGGGTGPLTRRMAELGADVLLVDGSAARAQAAAVRSEGLENVSVAVGTVFDLDEAEPFDVVLAVGMLEWSQSGPGGAEGMLRKAASALAPEGVLAVAIENAIGLKYLLGYAEDHVGLPWVGWEGYTGIDYVRTYSRRELATMLTAAGLPEQAWFFPFPDYKLPTVIVSEAAYALDDPEVVDAIVPRPAVPEPTLPILLSDPRAAHRTMLGAGLGPDIANSFLVVAGRSADAVEENADRKTLAWLSGTERRSRFMRDRRLVRDGASLTILDEDAGAEVADGWLSQRRFPSIPFESGQPLDRLISDALAAGDAGRTRELLRLWVQALRERAFVPDAASDANPFGGEEGRLALPGDHIDSQPANYVHRDGGLYRIDAEWEAQGALDFELVAVRGLLHLAVDMLTRGVSTQRANGRDVASVVAALADVCGVDAGRALDRLPAAEAKLQALVRGVPADSARRDLERLLRSSADALATRTAGPTVTAIRTELEAELEALRAAHEAQARQQVAERLALAEQMEREVETLREEIEWRKGVMEHQEKQLETLKQSRSLRYTEPLRRAAATFRRR
jgi:2-polyprenyl-3-methyl-5-hydroxy-6-metoxy-1,4-benzoquinol methylase